MQMLIVIFSMTIICITIIDALPKTAALIFKIF